MRSSIKINGSPICKNDLIQFKVSLLIDYISKYQDFLIESGIKAITLNPCIQTKHIRLFNITLDYLSTSIAIIYLIADLILSILEKIRYFDIVLINLTLN